jgi:hypothetical protein
MSRIVIVILIYNRHKPANWSTGPAGSIHNFQCILRMHSIVKGQMSLR